MRRRELLAGAGTALGGFAGPDRVHVEDATVIVLGDDGDGRRDGAAVESTAVASSLERGEQDCAGGDDADEATVEFADGAVLVEGAIETPTPCHELELESTTDDADRDVLVVAVTVGDAGEGVCVQCLGIVGYEARIDVDGRSPGRVEVVHERYGEAVAVESAVYESD